MAKLTTRGRKTLPASAFVFSKTRKFPVPDAAHARNALARAGAKGPAVKAAVARKVHATFPQIHQAGATTLGAMYRRKR